MRKTWIALFLFSCLLSVVPGSVQTGALAANDSSDRASPVFTQEHARPLPRRLFRNLTFQTGAVIPGLKEGAVPQGLTHVPQRGLYLMTAYIEGSTAPSQLFLVDDAMGALVKSFSLGGKNGSPHHGHVGGVGSDGESVWIASDGVVLTYRPFERLAGGEASEFLAAEAEFTPETRADFLTFHEGTLYVGEFYLKGKYETKHGRHLVNKEGKTLSAWMAGYRKGRVETILATRNKVQGAVFDGDRIYLSISYGRKKRSRIEIYRNPLGEPPQTTVRLQPDGPETGVWFLDRGVHEGTIHFPPMTEGITVDHGQLTVLVESGAGKYQKGGMGPVDYLIHLPLESLTPTPGK